MAISRKKKEEILARVKDIVQTSPTVVFVNFHGLSVADDTEMRAELREQDVGYCVAKKTLVKRALEDAGVEGAVPDLEGELALAYGEDVVAPARGVREFGKKHEGMVSILGGIFDGMLYGRAAVEEIAAIPSTDALRGMFVNVINSPIQGLVVALNAIAESKN